MDSLTATIASVIDNDPRERKWVRESVCEAGRLYDAIVLRRARSCVPSHDTKEGHIRGVLTIALHDHAASVGAYTQHLPYPHRLFANAAISHMRTHTDWSALAQHCMDEIAKGTPTD